MSSELDEGHVRVRKDIVPRVLEQIMHVTKIHEMSWRKIGGGDGLLSADPIVFIVVGGLPSVSVQVRGRRLRVKYMSSVTT